MSHPPTYHFLFVLIYVSSNYVVEMALAMFSGMTLPPSLCLLSLCSHPTSSSSAAEVMSVLFFQFMRYSSRSRLISLQVHVLKHVSNCIVKITTELSSLSYIKCAIKL